MVSKITFPFFQSLDTLPAHRSLPYSTSSAAPKRYSCSHSVSSELHSDSLTNNSTQSYEVLYNLNSSERVWKKDGCLGGRIANLRALRLWEGDLPHIDRFKEVRSSSEWEYK